MSSKSVKNYGEGNCTLEEVLEQIFLTETPADWVLMNETKPKKKKEEKKKKTDCTASNGKIKAILSRVGNYAGNFSYYARGDGKARADEVYNKISKNMMKSPGVNNLNKSIRINLDEFFSEHFTISGVNCNFNSKAKLKFGQKKYVYARMSKPYAWNAHHLIPCEAFTIMKATTRAAEPIFNDLQYELLLMSDYNVNNGNNMMALPSNNMSFFQPVHNLLQHPGNHDEYTKRVINEMKKVSKDLENLTDDLEKPHPNVEVKIASVMKTIENLLWDLLVKLGEVVVTSAINKPKIELDEIELDKIDKLMIKDQSLGGTKYPMWALT